jgi:DNA-binding response OmpR family regulator
MAEKILLVEDDPTLGLLLRDFLRLNEFDVFWATTGEDAQKWWTHNRPALAILDIMLPDTDGFELLKMLRKAYPQVPVVFLTARSLLEDQKAGYRLGADDYLVKPFDSELLLLKIKAILSRSSDVPSAEPSQELRFGKSLLIPSQRRFVCGGLEFHLSPRETELLTFLATHRDQVCRRSDILERLWGENSPQSARSMDVYITRLRKYLAHDSSIVLSNIHNEGYILRVQE